MQFLWTPAVGLGFQYELNYLHGRAFYNWHPVQRSMLIGTRFADTPQLHWVSAPGGARRQLTFSSEPVRGGAFRPKTGDCILYTQDAGGGEFFQLYRYDVREGRTTLLSNFEGWP